MKWIVMVVCLCFVNSSLLSQDTLYIKGGEKIPVSTLKLKNGQYRFTYNSGTQKGAVIESLVDSFFQLQPAKKSKKQQDVFEQTASANKAKNWNVNVYLSLGLGNNLSINDPSGLPDKSSLSGDVALDVNANYQPANKRFSATNELHYLLSVQKQSLTRSAHLQIAQDNINTLHDIAWRTGKNSSWNINSIIRISTPLITQFDGNYFANHTGLGRISGLASPYELTFAPGIKYQPNQAFRFSVSPYSFRVIGVTMTDVLAKGLYITDIDALGNYKTFVFKRLGAEINLWFDKQIKESLSMQYRISISGNYFEQIAKNGMLDGLFITRFRLIKDLYLTHRLSIQYAFSNAFFKPFLNQNILLSYSKSL